MNAKASVDIDAATRVKPGSTPSGAVLIGDRLSRSELLERLDEDQRAAFMKLATIIELDSPGARLVREGEPAENFYFILEGEAEVVKRDPKTGAELQLTTLGPGDHFGESSLLREGSRTASVVAVTPMVLVMVRARTVRESPHEHSWLAPLLLGLDRMTHSTIDILRREVDAADERESEVGVVLLVILALALYAMGVALVRELLEVGLLRTTLIRVLDVGLAGGVIMTIRSGSPLDWRARGLRMAERWPLAAAELGLTTFGCLAVLSVLASSLRASTGAEGPLFSSPDDLFVEVVYMFGVAVIVSIEELVVRGALQTGLDAVLRGRQHRLLIAILLSNALFAAVHTPISANYALLQFALGLFWGFVYSRHRALPGIVVSHVLVVYFALRVLRLEELLAGSS